MLKIDWVMKVSEMHSFRRDWRVRKVHIHQTDANHPWSRLLRRGQTRLHQTGLPEHLHGHAEYDQGHGSSEDLLR